MPTSDFNQIFDSTALELFASFEQEKSIFSFLSRRLPLKFGITKGVLVNTKKEATSESLLLYDSLNCPKLYLDDSSKTQLIPANYLYGTVSFINQLNQETLGIVLNQNSCFLDVYDNQLIDNQLAVKPLNVWFVTDLETFISLDDLEDRLLAEENQPDLVAILNRGLLITLTKHTISQIFSLEQKGETQSFDKAITTNLIDITEKTLSTKYFKMGASASYKNLFYFYVLLLNLLQNQPLIKTELSAEMVAIWGGGDV